MRLFPKQLSVQLCCFAVILFVSCTSNENPNDSLTNKVQSILNEEWLGVDLEYGEAQQFLVRPEIFDSSLFLHKTNWDYWKEQFNYREEQPFRRVELYSGWHNGGIELYDDGIIVKNDTLELDSRFAFNSEGNLLNFRIMDESFYHYNKRNDVAQYIEFDLDGSFNQSRHYTYDVHGNLMNYTQIFDDEAQKKYINIYTEYDYCKVDSGVYIKETEYYNHQTKNHIDRNFTFYFVNNSNQLIQSCRSSYVKMLGYNVASNKVYSYNNNGKINSIVTSNLMQVNEKVSHVWQYDDFGRIVKYTYQNNDRAIIDSVVYGDNEKSKFNKYINPSSHDLVREDGLHEIHHQKFDGYSNEIESMYADYFSLSDSNKWNHFKYDLSYLPNHTWTYRKSILGSVSEVNLNEDSLWLNDYSIEYRKFSNSLKGIDIPKTESVEGLIDKFKKEIANYNEQ